MVDGIYDWYWRRKPCPKSPRCHWGNMFKQPRGYCWDCVKLAREQFKKAFEDEVRVEADRVDSV